MNSAVLVGLFVLPSCDRSKEGKPSGELVIASYGGAWQDAQRKAMFDPFAKQAGVKVKDVVYDGQYAVIKEMVQAGRVEWDIVDVEGNMVELGRRDGLLLPIERSRLPLRELFDGAVAEYGVGIVAWSWVLAYRDGELTDDQLTTPWHTFFDVAKVPGNRGLRDDPRRVLEIALLGDGVALEKIYPLDLDRAFGKLSQLRRDLKASGKAIVWWSAQAQPPQLIAEKEVVMSAAANGRVVDARKGGASVAFTWNQGIVDLDWWIIPKGSKDAKVAMDFIAFASSVAAQTRIAMEIPYGPVNRAAIDALPESTRVTLPTFEPNLKRQIWFNTSWWAENGPAIQERWNAWRLSDK